MSTMAVLLFGSLPETISKEFSGIVSGGMNENEKETLKKLVIDVFLEDRDFRAPLSSVSSKVKMGFMKKIVPMFVIGELHRGLVKHHISLAGKIIAEISTLPSEVKDGMTLLMKQGPEVFPSIERCREEDELKDVLADVADSLTTLVKKYERFEFSEPRLREEKTKAVKFLVEMMSLYKVDGERAEKMKECMKSISKDESGLEEILEKGDVENLSDLLSKAEEEHRQLVAVEALVVQGSHMMNHAVFDYKWNNNPSNMFSAEIHLDKIGDGICFVELLAHYLNTKTIPGPATTGELKAYLFGEDKTGSHCVMLVITLGGQEDARNSVIKGVSIRSSSREMCDHVRGKVYMLQAKLDLMKLSEGVNDV